MKKGFTLIELLAVIVILGVIMAIAVPSVSYLIEKSKKDSLKSSTTLLADAAKLYYSSKEAEEIPISNIIKKSDKLFDYSGKVDDFTLGFNSEKEIAIVALQGKYCGYKYYDTDEVKIGTVKEGLCYINDIKIDTNNFLPNAVYTDTILNGTDPILGTGMIPVTIANDGTVTYADVNSSWYDYTSKKWANAVKLVSGTYIVGQVIPEANIQSYFVWVPRYKYKIFNIGNYASAITGTPPSSTKQTIDIVFESKSTAASTGNAVGTYLTHPAFTSLNTNGIWVGKYETGYNGATTTATAQVTSSDSTKIIVKPNVYGWRNNTVYNMFVSNYNYDRTNDSHMMKNTEWGAVAYLSHSIYGINKEENINNNSSFKTGYSSLTTINQTSYPGNTGDGAAYNNAYNTTTGYLASTTGNISGIYDMSGGTWEYMASYMSGQLGSSGFTTANIATYNSKYFDVYSASSTITSYNYRILGDATGEIGPFYSYADGDSNTRNHNSWYADTSLFVDSSSPWFGRGGIYDAGVLAGQFYFGRNTGAVLTYGGSRLVLAN